MGVRSRVGIAAASAMLVIALAGAGNGVMVTSANAEVSEGADLSSYRWSNRLVLVFAPTSDHPVIAQQQRILRHCRQGFRDRELRVFEVAGDGPVVLDGRPDRSFDAEALRRRFGVGDWEVRSLLIGKDGGVRLRSGGAIDPSRLFDTIDAMPMRRSEINERRGRVVGCAQ